MHSYINRWARVFTVRACSNLIKKKPLVPGLGAEDKISVHAHTTFSTNDIGSIGLAGHSATDEAIWSRVRSSVDILG